MDTIKFLLLLLFLNTSVDCLSEGILNWKLKLGYKYESVKVSEYDIIHNRVVFCSSFIANSSKGTYDLAEPCILAFQVKEKKTQEMHIYLIPAIPGEEVLITDENGGRYDIDGSGLYKKIHEIDLYIEGLQKNSKDISDVFINYIKEHPSDEAIAMMTPIALIGNNKKIKLAGEILGSQQFSSNLKPFIDYLRYQNTISRVYKISLSELKSLKDYESIRIYGMDFENMRAARDIDYIIASFKDVNVPDNFFNGNYYHIVKRSSDPNETTADLYVTKSTRIGADVLYSKKSKKLNNVECISFDRPCYYYRDVINRGCNLYVKKERKDVEYLIAKKEAEKKLEEAEREEQKKKAIKELEEQKKIREQKAIEEQRKNEDSAKRKSELKNRRGQWVNLTRDVEGYGYIKKVRVKTNIVAQSTSGCSIFFVTYYEGKPTYLVLNTNSWVVYIDGDEYKKLNTLPKKGDWVEFDFQNLTQLYSLKNVDASVPVEAIQFCEMNDNEIAEINKKLKPYQVVKSELKEKEFSKMMDDLYKKYGKKYVDAANRGEIMVGMHEELVALVCMYNGSTLQMKYDNGQSKKYDIYAIRDVRTGYHQITEKSVWIGSVWIANHKVTSVTYGERWSR